MVAVHILLFLCVSLNCIKETNEKTVDYMNEKKLRDIFRKYTSRQWLLSTFPHENWAQKMLLGFVLENSKSREANFNELERRRTSLYKILLRCMKIDTNFSLLYNRHWLHWCGDTTKSIRKIYETSSEIQSKASEHLLLLLKTKWTNQPTTPKPENQG